MFFHVIASDYLRALAADRSPPTVYSHARLFLACRATELSIKSFLSLQGMTMVELSKPRLGHNLAALLAEARKRGLERYLKPSAQYGAAIKKATKYYDEKVFEYPALLEAMRAYSDSPDVEVLAEFSTLLLNAIYADCRKQ